MSRLSTAAAHRPGEAAERGTRLAVRLVCRTCRHALDRSLFRSASAARARVAAAHRHARRRSSSRERVGRSSCPAADETAASARSAPCLRLHRVPARQQARSECGEAVQVPRAEDVPSARPGPAWSGVRGVPPARPTRVRLRGDQSTFVVQCGRRAPRAPSSAPRKRFGAGGFAPATKLARYEPLGHGALSRTTSSGQRSKVPVHAGPRRSAFRLTARRPTRRAAPPVAAAKRSAARRDADDRDEQAFMRVRGGNGGAYPTARPPVPSPRCSHRRRDRRRDRRVLLAIALSARSRTPRTWTIVGVVERSR